jgi:hypothetical protein
VSISDFEYWDPPPRAAKVLENFFPDELIDKRVAKLRAVAPRSPDGEGTREFLDDVRATAAKPSRGNSMRKRAGTSQTPVKCWFATSMPA